MPSQENVPGLSLWATCFFYFSTHYLYPGLILLLVAPSRWRSAIKAHPERWVAVIHSLAEQTLAKDNTVPNVSRGVVGVF